MEKERNAFFEELAAFNQEYEVTLNRYLYLYVNTQVTLDRQHSIGKTYTHT